MAAYGNEAIHMPNLNRFCDRATVTEYAYCTQPVCTPSRASLLSGLTPHAAQMTTNNLMLPKEVQCVPEYLPNTYSTAHIGKWHLGDEIFVQHGFDEWVSTEDSYHNFYDPERDQDARSAYHHYLVECGYEPADHPLEWVGKRFSRNTIMHLPEPECRPQFIAEKSIQYLREKHNDPFALYINFLEPHMPFYGCRNHQYDPDSITLPENFMHELDETYPLRLREMAKKYAQGYDMDVPLENEAQWRRLIAKYWGLCSLVDTCTGYILDQLERLGLMDNTIVVFTSDHGDSMGSHGLLSKTTMFEESARIPFLMKLPGQKEGRSIKGPWSHLDMVPTLFDAMGLPIPEPCQGESRLAWYDGSTTDTGDDAFLEWHGAGVGRQAEPLVGDPPNHEDAPEWQRESVRCVVTKDFWKLCLNSLGQHELYDLNTDPFEMHNRINDHGQASRVQLMRAKIADWQERTGDDLMTLPEVEIAG